MHIYEWVALIVGSGALGWAANRIFNSMQKEECEKLRGICAQQRGEVGSGAQFNIAELYNLMRNTRESFALLSGQLGFHIPPYEPLTENKKKEG